jgi:hypothetical protein
MTLILKLLVPAITFFVALIPLAIEEKWLKLHDGRTTKHKRAVVILIGMMLILTGITCAVVYVDEKNSERLTSEVERKTLQILELAQTNVTLSASLVSLSEQNTALVNSERDLITGGRLYCTFFPNNYRTNDVFDLPLLIQGSHALGPSPVLRDVTVFITRPRESASRSAIDTPYRVRTWTRDNGRAVTDELFFPALHLDNRGFIQCKLDLSGFTSDSCLVEFFSANGSWVQALQFARVNGEWTYAVTTMPCLSTMSFISPHQQVFGPFPTNLLMEKKRIYPNG